MLASEMSGTRQRTRTIQKGFDLCPGGQRDERQSKNLAMI